MALSVTLGLIPIYILSLKFTLIGMAIPHGSVSRSNCGEPTWNNRVLAPKAQWTTHALRISFHSIPMGYGRQTRNKPQKLLNRRNAYSHAYWDTGSRCGRKEPTRRRTNINIESSPLPGGGGSRQVTQNAAASRSGGEEISTIPRHYRGGI